MGAMGVIAGRSRLTVALGVAGEELDRPMVPKQAEAELLMVAVALLEVVGIGGGAWGNTLFPVFCFDAVAGGL